MSATKVAVSLDETLVQRLDKLVQAQVFRSRSDAIQQAVAEKINRMDKTQLERECEKLDASFERAMADEGLAQEVTEWPKY